jgi:predicted TIM-barrel fold metal-dependent hydrolase
MTDPNIPPIDLHLRDFIPRPKLSVNETQIDKPGFPVIDAHNHLGETFGGGWCKKPVPELLEVMDAAGVCLLVDLDGGWGEAILNARLDKYKSAAPERFCIFGGVAWNVWPEKGEYFGEWAALRLQSQARRGAQGLKIWKPFGLQVRDHLGALVPVNDARLDPIWHMAGELRLPVMIHVADPVAFFDPLDPTNERWEELNAHPDWQFPSPPYPDFLTILGQLANLVERHPGTTFIGAHVGCYAENLAWVGSLLDRCPNFYVDIAARIGELGRQPYTARRFFLKYSDRILFGLDCPARVDWYRLYYRFLETNDDYFNYDLEDPPTQGRWRIYGLHLPQPVLEKIYFRNAQRLLGFG